MKPGCLVKYRWSADTFRLHNRPGDPEALDLDRKIPVTEVGVVLDRVDVMGADRLGPTPYTWCKVMFGSGTGWIGTFDLEWV